MESIQDWPINSQILEYSKQINSKLDILLSNKSRSFDTVWVDNLLTGLKTNGEAAAFTFVEGNYVLLGGLGLDVAQVVLTLFAKGHTSAAQVILDSRMTMEQINTQLGVITADATTAAAVRQQFYADLEHFALALLPIATSLLFKAAVGAATGGIGAIL